MPITDRMNIGARLSDSSLRAIVMPPGSSCFRRLLVDMDPLLVAGRLRKQVDAFLSDIDPFAGTNLGADGFLDFTEVAEAVHVPRPVSSDLHFRNISRDGQVRLRYCHYLGNSDARGGFL